MHASYTNLLVFCVLWSLDVTWLNIDCGATSTSKDEITGLTWETDDQFIKIGQNNFLPMNNIIWPIMKTLQSFLNGSKNCYNINLNIQSKYILRACFYYGNYDNLLKPPTFFLKVSAGSNKTFRNVTVITSLSDDPNYHEIMFVTTNETMFPSFLDLKLYTLT